MPAWSTEEVPGYSDRYTEKPCFKQTNTKTKNQKKPKTKAKSKDLTSEIRYFHHENQNQNDNTSKPGFINNLVAEFYGGHI